MHRLVASGSLLAAFMLGACATGAPPTPQSAPPKTLSSAGFTVARTALVDETNHMQKHVDRAKQIVYFQNFGGGGAGLGVLLGPIGVAANISMIDGVTQKDVDQIKDRIAIDPGALFAEAARRHNLPAGQGGDAPRVTPYLLLSKANETTVLAAAALIVEQGQGATLWRGKYMLQLPRSYSVAELAALDATGTEQLRQAMAQGFDALLVRLQAEATARADGEKAITFKSDLLSPRFDFEMSGRLIADDGQLAWVRVIGGVFAVRKPNIQYTLSKS
jgi:hypothetical protein